MSEFFASVAPAGIPLEDGIAWAEDRTLKDDPLEWALGPCLKELEALRTGPIGNELLRKIGP